MAMAYSVLIVDDDAEIRQSVRLCLEPEGARVLGAGTSAGALEILDRSRFDSSMQLAEGFNRMAEALAEFHRSNLGEVLGAKETLEATLAALPNGVIVIDPDGRIAAANALARSVLQAIGTAHAERLDDLPFPPPSLRALRAALQGEHTLETHAELSWAFSVSWS